MLDSILPYKVSIGDDEAISTTLNEVEIDESLISMDISINISIKDVTLGDLAVLIFPDGASSWKGGSI